MLIGVGIVVVGAVSFYGGMQYQSSLRGTGRAGGFGGQAATRGAQNRPVTGDVVSVDTDSLTVKVSDGSTKIVNIAPDTSYAKTATATASEVQVGTKVGVFGQTNSDGSVTAQSVQLNPQFRGPNGQQ